MNRNSPYFMTSSALISLSGGRTSGFMMRQILDAHEGQLPEGVHVAFANTGKEREETLEFVNEMQTRWKLPVIWLEYQTTEAGDGYREVSFLSASRKGEPFAELIRKKQYLPNPVTRYCTSELKIRVMKKFMIDQGYEEWDVILGLRADEPMRAHRASLSCARERWLNRSPMLYAGHTLDDVMRFWGNNDFDLKLKQHEGNCDLCFLKGSAKIERIMIDRPDLSHWWIEQEQRIGATFRNDRPSYSHLLKILKEQDRFDFDCMDFDTCACTD